jgi:hypothetical protein
VAAGLLLLTMAPNLAWNLRHGFATVAHTVADADLAQTGDGVRSSGSFDLRRAPGFLLAQFGVFGPIPFAALVGGAVVLGLRRGLTPEDTLLLAIALPPLAIILVEAAVSRANANWAAVTYAPGAVLVAAWLLRWRARWALVLALVSQGLAGAVFIGAVASPRFADRIGLANSFKRMRGWRDTAQAIENQARQSGPLSAIAVDDRFLFNAFSYYGRGYLAAQGRPPLKMWVRLNRPGNEAELAAPLTPAAGARVLVASAAPDHLQQELSEFRANSFGPLLQVRLDPKHERQVRLFLGLGFDPPPRLPVNGSPTRP